MGFSVFRGLGNNFLLFNFPCMEDLTKSWSCLTLSDVEGSNLRLTEEEAMTV